MRTGERSAPGRDRPGPGTRASRRRWAFVGAILTLPALATCDASDPAGLDDGDACVAPATAADPSALLSVSRADLGVAARDAADRLVLSVSASERPQLRGLLESVEGELAEATGGDVCRAFALVTEARDVLAVAGGEGADLAALGLLLDVVAVELVRSTR